jgi:predicted enzyme related to lactoylglutathione lyase
MNRIVHISLKVDDVKRTGDFYQEVRIRRCRDPQDARSCLAPHDDGQIDFR